MRPKASISMDGKLTVVEAAKLLPHSERALRRLCFLNRIKCIKLGRDWYIYNSEIDRILKEEASRD